MKFNSAIILTIAASCFGVLAQGRDNQIEATSQARKRCVNQPVVTYYKAYTPKVKHDNQVTQDGILNTTGTKSCVNKPTITYYKHVASSVKPKDCVNSPSITLAYNCKPQPNLGNVNNKGSDKVITPPQDTTNNGSGEENTSPQGTPSEENNLLWVYIVVGVGAGIIMLGAIVYFVTKK